MQHQGVAVAHSGVDQNKENSVQFLPHQNVHHAQGAVKSSDDMKKKKAPLGMVQGQNGSTGNPAPAHKAPTDTKKLDQHSGQTNTLTTDGGHQTHATGQSDEVPQAALQLQAPQVATEYENMDAEARKVALDNLRKKLRASKRPSEIVPAIASSQGTVTVPRPSISTPIAMGPPSSRSSSGATSIPTPDVNGKTTSNPGSGGPSPKLPPSEERARLWDAVQRDEKAPEPWWNFLCFEYKIGGISAEGIVEKLRSEVFTLLDMTKLKSNEAYMNLWLLYAKLQPSTSLTERHEIYRSMSEHGIGQQNASFYINWALFEHKQQHNDCIREIVRLAVVNDAQPAARVHKLAQDCGIRVDSVVNPNANAGVPATNVLNHGSSLPSGPAVVVATAGRSMPTPLQHRPTEAPSLGITAGDLAKIKNWTPSIPARRSQESAPQSSATSARPPVTKTKPLGLGGAQRVSAAGDTDELRSGSDDTSPSNATGSVPLTSSTATLASLATTATDGSQTPEDKKQVKTSSISTITGSGGKTSRRTVQRSKSDGTPLSKPVHATTRSQVDEASSTDTSATSNSNTSTAIPQLLQQSSAPKTQPVTLANITPPSGVVAVVPSATVSPTAGSQQSAVAGMPQQQLPVTRPAFLAPAQQVVAAASIPAPSAQAPSTTATAANAPASSTTTAQPRKGPSPAEIHSNWMSASAKMGTSTLVVRGITYMMLGRIGSGGSSKVYKVLSSANFNVYAMKVVFLEGQDEGTLEQYKNEVRYLREFAAKAKLARETGDLHHHNTIIELVDFEVNEKEKRLYIVLEYAELDLHKLLKSYGGILINNLNMLRYFWEGMLRAVQTVHEHRVVHSDLKPPNFVVVKGAVKIIDFGIAKAINQNTTNIVRQDIVGTLNYMAPEAITGTAPVPGNGKCWKLGRPADVWALGCILYQMVYGAAPFAHIENMIGKIAAIPNENHKIEMPRESHGIQVPDALMGVMRACLLRDAKLRPTIPDLLAHPFLTATQGAPGVTQ